MNIEYEAPDYVFFSIFKVTGSRNIFVRLLQHQTATAYGRLEVWLHAFVSSKVHGYEWAG